MRRRLPWGLLALAFVIVPVLEIYVLIQVGQVIGGWETVLALVVVSVLGSYLIKREGARAWQALRLALQTYRMPAKELADGALILIGGTLLLTPGFLSDIVGLFFVVPFTRPVARRMLTAFVSRKVLGGAVVHRRGAPPPDGWDAGAPSQGRRRPGTDSVVRGEVVD